MSRVVTLLALLLAACADRPADQPGAWRITPQPSGTDASLRGLSPIDGSVAWASGSGGTVLSTADGGVTWQRHPVAGAETLDLRDVAAFDADTALVSTAGSPARVYRTEDGGRTWSVVYEDSRPEAFFDAMAFWDREHGLLFGDPVHGRFTLLRTTDGGRSWRAIDTAPPPLEGEAGFAASGTCVAVAAGGRAWIGTGGSVVRVLRSGDNARSWTATPVAIGDAAASSGVFSVAFRDAGAGIVVGGDYQRPGATGHNGAWSNDGGRTWRIAKVSPRGYRSCVAWVPGERATAIAVGVRGSDVSIDGGRTWRPLGDDGYHVVAFGADGAGWMAGDGGRVARIERVR